MENRKNRYCICQFNDEHNDCSSSSEKYVAVFSFQFKCTQISLKILSSDKDTKMYFIFNFSSKNSFLASVVCVNWLFKTLCLYENFRLWHFNLLFCIIIFALFTYNFCKKTQVCANLCNILKYVAICGHFFVLILTFKHKKLFSRQNDFQCRYES